MSHFNRVKQSSPFRHSLISPKSFTNVFPADNPHHPIQTPSCSSRQTFSRRRRLLRHSAAHSCIHYSLILDTRLVSWRFTQRNRKKTFSRAQSMTLILTKRAHTHQRRRNHQIILRPNANYDDDESFATSVFGAAILLAAAKFSALSLSLRYFGCLLSRPFEFVTVPDLCQQRPKVLREC